LIYKIAILKTIKLLHQQYTVVKQYYLDNCKQIYHDFNLLKAIIKPIDIDFNLCSQKYKNIIAMIYKLKLVLFICL